MRLNEMKSSSIVFLIKSSSKCGSTKCLSSKLLKKPVMISVQDEARAEGLWRLKFCRHSIRLSIPQTPHGVSWAVFSQNIRHSHSKQCAVWGHCPQPLVAAWHWTNSLMTDAVVFPEARLGRWDTKQAKASGFHSFLSRSDLFQGKFCKKLCLGLFWRWLPHLSTLRFAVTWINNNWFFSSSESCQVP